MGEIDEAAFVLEQLRGCAPPRIAGCTGADRLDIFEPEFRDTVIGIGTPAARLQTGIRIIMACVNLHVANRTNRCGPFAYERSVSLEPVFLEFFATQMREPAKARPRRRRD